MLKYYNFSDFKIWDNINRLDIIKNHTLMIPEKLDDLEEFPLNTLLDHLDQLQPIKDMNVKSFPTWGYMVVITGIVIIFIVSIIIYCKCRKSLLSKLIKHRGKARTREQIAIMPNNELTNANEGIQCYRDETVVMSSLSGDETREATNENSPGEAESSVLKRKFPVLDSQLVYTAVTK